MSADNHLYMETWTRHGRQHSFKVCNHVIAVYSENKLKHYTTVYRNHKSAGEKLGLFIFCKFFMYFVSKYISACSEITF